MVNIKIFNIDNTEMTQEEWDSCSTELQIKYFLISITKSYIKEIQATRKFHRFEKELNRIVTWFDTKWGDMNEWSEEELSKSRIEKEIDYHLNDSLVRRLTRIVELFSADPF